MIKIISFCNSLVVLESNWIIKLNFCSFCWSGCWCCWFLFFRLFFSSSLLFLDAIYLFFSFLSRSNSSLITRSWGIEISIESTVFCHIMLEIICLLITSRIFKGNIGSLNKGCFFFLFFLNLFSFSFFTIWIFFILFKAFFFHFTPCSHCCTHTVPMIICLFIIKSVIEGDWSYWISL